MPNLATLFIVAYTIIVDRPELRCATLPRVAPGTAVPQRRTFTTRKDALAVFNAIVRGDEDFGSEFVRSAQVWSTDLDGCNPRTIRSLITRERDGSWAKVA